MVIRTEHLLKKIGSIHWPLNSLATRWGLLDARVCTDQPYAEFRNVKDRFESFEKTMGVLAHESYVEQHFVTG